MSRLANISVFALTAIIFAVCLALPYSAQATTGNGGNGGNGAHGKHAKQGAQDKHAEMKINGQVKHGETATPDTSHKSHKATSQDRSKAADEMLHDGDCASEHCPACLGANPLTDMCGTCYMGPVPPNKGHSNSTFVIRAAYSDASAIEATSVAGVAVPGPKPEIQHQDIKRSSIPVQSGRHTVLRL